MVLCIKQSFWSRETMSGKAPMSDEEEEFGCSSDNQISNSEHSDESSCSLDLGDVIEDCVKKTHDLFGKAKKHVPTLADALANMTFIKCEAKTSGIHGIGLFVQEPADPGDPLAILSLPTEQLTGNFLNPPENCVLVTRDKKSTTYQKWLQIDKRKNGYPPAIGGCANAPPRGKKENAVIVKISFGKSPDLEYATILVATCRFKAGKEVLLKYDNSGDNNDYFLEEERKEVAAKHRIYSRRTKKVLKVEKHEPDVDDGEASSGNKRNVVQIDAGNGGCASSAAESTKYYLVKYVWDQNGPITLYYPCVCTEIVRFINGKPKVAQTVIMRHSGKKQVVDFFHDMEELFAFCKRKKVFFFPWAPPPYFIAERPGLPCMIAEETHVIGEKRKQVVQVYDYWLNQLMSLYGMNGPYEVAFDMMFKLMMLHIQPIKKHEKHKRQKLPGMCLNIDWWLPACARNLISLQQFVGLANSDKLPRIHAFIQEEVMVQLLKHNNKKCGCDFGTRFTVVDDDSAAAGGSARSAKDN